MSRFRHRDDEWSSTGTALGVLIGAVAGFAVGMYVAQRVGGVGGLTARLRRHRPEEEPGPHAAHAANEEEEEELAEFEEDEFEVEDYDEMLEERVLEAFRNDPVLSERAIDIGSIGEGVIELAGWVEEENEATHAVTIAGGVPGVETVVNRIAIGDEEERFEAAVRRTREGDPALTEARWEGRRVGTGRRRQGTSDEPDRHADPKVQLEDRWLDTNDAVRHAADDVEGVAERRTRTRSSTRGDRTRGGAVAPSGVPKADHVASPVDAERDVRNARVEPSSESAGRHAEPGDRD